MNAVAAKNIETITHCIVLELITQHHLGFLITKSTPDIECYGVYVLNHNSQKIETILSRTTFSNGGCGQTYRTTTNPFVSSGDGVAMVYRAKGRVENMEFIQFHPTALYEPGIRGQAFLITEAVRGDGGILRNAEGEAFMGKYDERKDIATRDIVARAIDNEMKIHGTEHVYLDCRHMNEVKFLEHFPNIYEKCKSIGIDVSKNMIPVSPAQHYMCGGIKTDENARTSIKYLYAAGECASTGLHGANRLASNSLLEAMVFAHRAYEDHLGLVGLDGNANMTKKIPEWNAAGTQAPRELILITQSLKELKQVMSDYVGIVRNNERLRRAERRIDLSFDETEALYKRSVISPQLAELRNMITVAYLIIKGAQLRHESRGLHFNTDYPEKSDIIQNTIL